LGDDLSEEDEAENEDEAYADSGEGSASEEEELDDEEVEDEAFDPSNDKEDVKEEDGSGSGSEDDYKEDIYGRTVNKKTGKVVTFDIKGAHKKLEDLDAKGGDNESKMKIDRILMGTLNRLSEGTLVRSCQAVSEVWQNNSKNAAYFVEVFLRGFVEEISHAQVQDDKKLENSAVFIAHLLNFHIVKGTVIIEVFEKLREQLNVDTLQISGCAGDVPRAKFLGETLLALQKSPPTSVDMSIIEHYLKLFHGMRKSELVF
ncbi:hypothetical protein COOONC_23111, partial [Cooperia oncophora]